MRRRGRAPAAARQARGAARRAARPGSARPPPSRLCRAPRPHLPAGLWSGAPLSQFVAGAELRDGRKLAPEELQATVLQAISMQ
jgi:hypothetical protein